MSNGIKGTKSGLNNVSIVSETLRGALKKTISQEFTADTFIPINLLNQIGKELVNPDKAIELTHGGRFGGRKPAESVTHDHQYKALAAQLAGEVAHFPRAYWAYYRALLQAMDTLVQNPGVPAVVSKTKLIKETRKSRANPGSSPPQYEEYEVTTASFNKTVVLHPSELIGDAPSTSINLKGQWKSLSPDTLDAKKALGNPVFWHHTGEAANDFHSRVTSRLAQIKVRHFVAGDIKTTIEGASRNSKGAGKYAAKATISMKVGVPSWNNKMDTLITIPFTTLRTDVSTLVGTGVDQNDSHGWKSSQNKKKAHGIDRLLIAEAHRPWLRDLSSQAGSALRKYLKDTTVSASPLGSRSPAAQAAQSHMAKRLEQLKKAKANHKERKAIIKAHNAEHEAALKMNRAFDKKAKWMSPEAKIARSEAARVARNERNQKLAEERKLGKAREAEKAARSQQHFKDHFLHHSENQQFTKEEIIAAKLRNKGIKPKSVTRAAKNPNTPVRAKVLSPKTGKMVASSTYSKHARELGLAKPSRHSDIDNLRHAQENLIAHLQSVGRLRAEKAIVKATLARGRGDTVREQQYYAASAKLKEKYK
jgi:hypothetical protein